MITQHLNVATITPTFLEFEPRFKRLGNQFVLRKKGRWGGRWLQSMVFWAAKNLGMIGHPKDFDEVVRYQIIDISDIREAAERAVLAAMDRGYSPDDLEIIVGPDQFKDLCRLADSIHEILQVDIRNGSRRWRGVRLSIVPWVQGLAVVPKSR